MARSDHAGARARYEQARPLYQQAGSVVLRAASRTTLTLSAASVNYGNEMPLKITVAVAAQFSGTPAGNVIVTAGHLTLCTVRLASATHTCSLPSERALSPGLRRVP